MPTIAEIIAARKAGAKNPATATTTTQAAAPKESLAERVELVEAINRIDAPGKRKGGSLVLDNAPLPPEPKEEVPAEPRMLGARVGEVINILPESPAPQAVAWDAVLNRWETDLVIMQDPEPGSEHAWIALKPTTGGGLPIMLHKLMFWPHPERTFPASEPF